MALNLASQFVSLYSRFIYHSNGLGFNWRIPRHSRYLELVSLMSKPDLSQYIMSEEVPLPPAQEIRPGDTYQIDSEEYDSDQERDNLSDGEYDRLVEEGGFGFSCV